MPKNLVIVESPAKAKTIEKYLGGDFTVASSFGHIRDLPKKGLNIDKDHGFEPTYAVSDDKKKVVAELKKKSKGAEVWLASDEDREGEAIAWHLTQALNLDPQKTKRIVFHEITKPAILEAIEHPRTVDKHLVDAQQARRVLDRLVGYELSPVLWKKVRTGLSAGRVQSVAVRLIVEREREIKDFKAEAGFKLTATFKTAKGQDIPAELVNKLPNEKAAVGRLESAVKAKFTVVGVDKKPGSRTPSAPFTTSTLQQEAARKLGYSVRQTMTLAQRLYEAGHITYMRTDSTNVSKLALDAAEKHITQAFGNNYYERRVFRTKNASAQEAHEAIRPTNIDKDSVSGENGQQRLYKLIWQRFVASQMSPAKVERTEYLISDGIAGHDNFLAKGEILLFDGFMKVYGGGKADVILPEVSQGETLALVEAMATEQFSKPPARYSEASLVRKLEEEGIGRPSTYAPTISTIQDRGYIEKRDLDGDIRQIKQLSLKMPSGKITTEQVEERFGADKAKLVPTALAEMSTDFLVKYFAPIVDYAFTASVEKEFDEIEEGKKAWNKMIAEFYNKDFVPLVKASEKVTRKETAQMRELGKDPKTGEPIFARFGRYGPMLQKGEGGEGDKKPVFAPLPEGARLEDVKLEEALKMFALPREVGKTGEGEAIVANIGRFGPYVQVGKTFVSIKDHDPFTINEATARQLIQEKQDKIAKSLVADFGKIQIKIGLYGPYITDGKKNAKVPKEMDPAKISEAEAKKILAEAPAKKRRFPRRAKKS